MTCIGHRERQKIYGSGVRKGGSRERGIPAPYSFPKKATLEALIKYCLIPLAKFLLLPPFLSFHLQIYYLASLYPVIKNRTTCLDKIYIYN